MTIVLIIALSIMVIAYKEAGDRSEEIRSQMLKSLN